MKTIKFILAIYKELFRSAFSFIREVFSDREAWGDLFHGIGLVGGIIIFGSPIFYIMFIWTWQITPGHELFWITCILCALCLCFKIGDWLKGEM